MLTAQAKMIILRGRTAVTGPPPVTGVPSLTMTKTDYGAGVAPPAMAISSAGFTDWIIWRGEGSYTATCKAIAPGSTTPVGRIQPSLGGYDSVAGPWTQGSGISTNDGGFSVDPGDDSWTDGVNQASASTASHRSAGTNEMLRIAYNSGPVVPRGVALWIPADSGTYHASIMTWNLSNADTPPPNAIRFQASILGASSPPAAIDDPSQLTDPGLVHFVRYDFTYSAGVDGGNLQLRYMCDTVGGATEPSNAHFGLCWVGYKAF